MKTRPICPRLAGIFCAVAAGAWAQQVVVTGKVITPSNQGIATVSVRLVSSKDSQLGRTPETTQTDASGAYRLTCDWADVTKANNADALWEIRTEKANYAPGRGNVLLARDKPTQVLPIVMLPVAGHEELMSKVDGCADKATDFKTVYVFDFANDSNTPFKFSTFQDLLGRKLVDGIKSHLEEAGLLSGGQLEIKSCRKAPVRDADDAAYAASRLQCSGVIWGFIEEKGDQFKSVVRFTVPTDPPLADVVPVAYSSDLDRLIEPDKLVDDSYLAFAAFVLGRQYVAQGQAGMAMKCFLYAQAIRPKSAIAKRAGEFLEELKRSNPARDLAPIGGPPL